LVTGGSESDSQKWTLSSTEIITSAGSSWLFVGELPKARDSLASISWENDIFVTVNFLSLKFNKETETWNEVGKLNITRRRHAMAAVKLAKIRPYCIQDDSEEFTTSKSTENVSLPFLTTV